MKKWWIVLLVVVFVAAAVAMVAGPARAAAGTGDRIGQYGSQKPAGEVKQEEPFTKDFFGPWNEAVAKTHIPMVTTSAAGMGMKVEVQIDNHPMDPQKPHWIMWIRVEDEKGKKLGEKMFKPTDPSPATATFELPKMYDKLKVFEQCNIHGVWLNEVTVEMK